MDNNTSHKFSALRNLYLYLVCFISLIMVVLPTADLVNIALKKTIFTKADVYYNDSGGGYGTSELHRSLARDIAYAVVGIPVFIFHWMQTRKKERN